MNNYWNNHVDQLRSKHDHIQTKLAMLGRCIDGANMHHVESFLNDCRTLERTAKICRKPKIAKQAKACQRQVWQTLKQLKIK